MVVMYDEPTRAVAFAPAGVARMAHIFDLPRYIEEDYTSECHGPHDASRGERARLGRHSGISWLNLKSLSIPIQKGSRIEMERPVEGYPDTVHILRARQRASVSALATPVRGDHWRTSLLPRIRETLERDGMEPYEVEGPMGPELHVLHSSGYLCLMGISRPRWTLRLTLSGDMHSLRNRTWAENLLADTIVKRGVHPEPAETPLDLSILRPKTT